MLHIAHITQYWQASSTTHPLPPKGANQHHQLYTTTDLPSAAHPPNQLPDGKSSPGHILRKYFSTKLLHEVFEWKRNSKLNCLKRRTFYL